MAFLQEWMGHAYSWMERLVEGKSTKPLGWLHLQGCLALAQRAALPTGIGLWPDHMCSGQMSPGLRLKKGLADCGYTKSWWSLLRVLVWAELETGALNHD